MSTRLTGIHAGRSPGARNADHRLESRLAETQLVDDAARRLARMVRRNVPAWVSGCRRPQVPSPFASRRSPMQAKLASGLAAQPLSQWRKASH
jgi:hypothetical protein